MVKWISKRLANVGWAIKRAILSRVAIPYRGPEDERFVAPDAFQQMFATAFSQAVDSTGLHAEDIPAQMEKIKPELPELIEGVAEHFYKGLLLQLPVIITDRKARSRPFEKRHQKRWKKGLDLLQGLIALSTEIGEEANRRLRAEDNPNLRLRVEALTRLHARSILVAQEIHALLAHGFPDGAQARWRSLHEIVVVASFLARGSDDLIKRYFEHDAIESWYAALEHNKYAAVLKIEPFTDAEMTKFKVKFAELETLYGKPYTTPYGWAASALGSGRPGLHDMEKAVGLDRLRPFYRMASHPTHANPKGIGFQLADMGGWRVLIAGPSNYGLTDPAQCTAESLYFATMPLLEMRQNLDVSVLKEVLWKFVHAIADSFWEVQSEMNAAESELQAAPD